MEAQKSGEKKKQLTKHHFLSAELRTCEAESETKSKRVNNVDFTSVGKMLPCKWTAAIPCVSVSPKDDEINHQSQMVEKLKEQMLKQEEVRELCSTTLAGLTEWQTVSLQSQIQQKRVLYRVTIQYFLASETKAFIK